MIAQFIEKRSKLLAVILICQVILDVTLRTNFVQADFLTENHFTVADAMALAFGNIVLCQTFVRSAKLLICLGTLLYRLAGLLGSRRGFRLEILSQK